MQFSELPMNVPFVFTVETTEEYTGARGPWYRVGYREYSRQPAKAKQFHVGNLTISVQVITE